MSGFLMPGMLALIGVMKECLLFLSAMSLMLMVAYWISVHTNRRRFTGAGNPGQQEAL
jgi:hypothetical protein